MAASRVSVGLISGFVIIEKQLGNPAVAVATHRRSEAQPA
jgi:hypothetical protein